MLAVEESLRIREEPCFERPVGDHYVNLVTHHRGAEHAGQFHADGFGEPARTIASLLQVDAHHDPREPCCQVLLDLRYDHLRDACCRQMGTDAAEVDGFQGRAPRDQRLAVEQRQRLEFRLPFDNQSDRRRTMCR